MLIAAVAIKEKYLLRVAIIKARGFFSSKNGLLLLNKDFERGEKFLPEKPIFAI